MTKVGWVYLAEKIKWALIRNHSPVLEKVSRFRCTSTIPASLGHNTNRQNKMTTATLVSRSLPALPEGWSADKDFKFIGKITASTQRAIEPVGPHFLAHARRARHKRTFSEDDRIQAQERAKKVEEDEDSEMSETEDPMMLQREAKDWKVWLCCLFSSHAASLSTWANILTVPIRSKITTLFSVFPSTASRPPRSKSSVPTARRS